MGSTYSLYNVCAAARPDLEDRRVSIRHEQNEVYAAHKREPDDQRTAGHRDGEEL